MTLGILKETDGEHRVAVTPDSLSALTKLGFDKILVERGAGATAFFDDASYEAQGAQIADTDAVLKNANVLARINPLSTAALSKMSAGQIVIGQFNPLGNREAVENLLKANVTGFSLDMAPRSTRAQALDVLSSMATVGGYKAVLTAAAHLPTFFPMFMTAAGTIKPAKVLILGAGVAGLQAIATAKRLGSVVEAFDVRAAAKEEVMSLGAKFVEVEGAVDDKSAGGYAVEQSEEFKQRQAQLIHDKAVAADVIICTAQIPGRKAPILIRKETVAAMKSGAVIVDMAASTGGNCELTENGKTTHPHGVTLIGDSNLAGSVSKDASVMFGKNIVNFLKLIMIKNELTLNWEDDIVAATCVAHEGKVVSERVKGQTAAQLGASAVELDARQQFKPQDMSGTAVRDLRRLLEDLNLRVAAISFQTRRGYDVADELERRVAATKATMKFAHELRAPVVINQIGRVPAESKGPGWELLTQALSDLSAYGHHIGALLAAQTGTEDGAAMARLLAALPQHGIGIDLDPGNLIINGFSPLEMVQAIGERVMHVHARDAVRDLARGRGIEVPLGRGSADFPALLGQLEEHDYRGYVTIARERSDDPVFEIGEAVKYLREL